MLMKMLVHIERVPEKMGLMSPSLLQALEFCHLEVVVQDIPVVGMGALLDDYSGAFSWGQASYISETLFV